MSEDCGKDMPFAIDGMTMSEAETALLERIRSKNDPSWKHPHAFHLNLPAHHIGDDGVPLITKYAHKKSKHVMALLDTLKLSESMFYRSDAETGRSDATMEDAEDEDDEDDDQISNDSSPTTLAAFIRKCSRLQGQLTSLESLKHSGLSRLDLCKIVLQLLRLVTASVTIDYESKDEVSPVTIHYDNVGYLHTTLTTIEEEKLQAASNLEETNDDLEASLDRNFALPAPAREVLLSMLVHLLSNKGPLRSISNASIYPKDQDSSERFLLILHWRCLLRMLLRTAPYLDEHKVGQAPSASNTRQSSIIKRTVQLIRDARHFFDQGVRPPGSLACSIGPDATARQVWKMVEKDVRYHSHTHAFYRSLIMLYLFQPSRCTPQYYVDLVPVWFECWSNIDRCPEMDFLWLALFCRARKYLPLDFDMAPLRRKLLTHAQHWLQLPIGGAALDKSFPRVASPRSRVCPARLKVFVGSASSYEEGIDFVAKVAKLLAVGLGRGEVDGTGISAGTQDILRFLSFATPYFNPSNLGSWTFTLGAFLHYFSYEFCSRVGIAGSMESMRETHRDLVDELGGVEPSLQACAIPPAEIVALLHSLLPLCQQALYSKNGHVGRAGEAAMLYLSQIDPARVTPAFIDFATRALDISAVNLAHQAPAALSALTRLLQPALRSNPTILLMRLPDILRLSLAGVDSNDQNKTIRTLILYRNMTSWLPVGGTLDTWCTIPVDQSQTHDGTVRLGSKLVQFLRIPCETVEYKCAIDSLPGTSLLKQSLTFEELDLSLLIEEASSALGDWALEFLERVYLILRATGEREKTGKTASGTANRHANADVQQARNFSRVLKETLVQTFVSMDDSIHKSAVSSVVRFLTEDTLPAAAKDASSLCQAVCCARLDKNEVISPGLDALVPILTENLEHNSHKTNVYRLRCLSGAVRSCGSAIVKHSGAVGHALKFALDSSDKHVFKTGCKLLRHTLSTLCEARPLAFDSAPRNHATAATPSQIFGFSSQLQNDPLRWSLPEKFGLELAVQLLEDNIFGRIAAISNFLEGENSSDEMSIDEDAPASLNLPEFRRCLKAVRYALRGGAGILLDVSHSDAAFLGKNGAAAVPEMDDTSLFPYESAMLELTRLLDAVKRQSLYQMRGCLCSFLTTLLSVIASESFGAAAKIKGTENQVSIAAPDRKRADKVSADVKVCKEACDIALILLTRRGAFFRSQESKTIWKAQKQLATDFALLAEADQVVESLQRAQLYGDCDVVAYKDGENGGKTLPRRLLVSRVQLYHEALQRKASFEVPRRLRRLQRCKNVRLEIMYSIDAGEKGLVKKMRSIADAVPSFPMDGYEGIIDGLFSLCCHSNTQVRASGIGVVDYAITRFGWIVKNRIPRLLAAVNLKDSHLHGKFGVPSTERAKDIVGAQGKRKRLAESLKGICSILAMSRPSKHILGNEKTRLEFIKTVCGPDDLIALMPAEEMQKMVHYLQSIFSPFRTKYYCFPRATPSEQQMHTDAIGYALEVLSSSTPDVEVEEAAKGAHWRKLLLACYFLNVLVDSEDMLRSDPELIARLWKAAFGILENEFGQPLQRVGLGLFGRLLMISVDISLLNEMMLSEGFCRILAKALVYDHKEDSSVGGGHEAQWSTGVADLIRDSSRNIAPKSLFPFQRTNQSSGTFKHTHAQLLEEILVRMGGANALTSADHLLSFGRELASSPPNEDQRNQQVTSAEMFAGVSRALMRLFDADTLEKVWEDRLIPFLDDVMPKIPTSLAGAFFDSVRFAIQFSAPEKFFALTRWLSTKIETTLWQEKTNPKNEDPDDEGKSGVKNQGLEGFTAQTKWLYLCSALLIELDETEFDGCLSRVPWYADSLMRSTARMDVEADTKLSLRTSWSLVSEKLLPRLTDAMGHPYESCRDHIAGCLFRICYCYRKMTRESASRAPSRTSSGMLSTSSESTMTLEPGAYIVDKISSLSTRDDLEFQVHFSSLIAARRFISYCIHFGETKYEFSKFIIPLLPMAFEAVKSNSEDGVDASEPDNVAKRALESEVAKGYRASIAELSVAPILSYGAGEDISRVLDTVGVVSKHDTWQVRHAAANFLRCFQGGHKFLFSEGHEAQATTIAAELLSDDRREVSSAAMAAITGIISVLSSKRVSELVTKYEGLANKTTMKKKKKKPGSSDNLAALESLGPEQLAKELARAKTQKTSVHFLCAVVLSRPYDTPEYVPRAIAAISKHSFERNAPLGVRDVVKKCCAEYKRTHMSDNWEMHRRAFSQDQLEALEDVVSTPHYYA